MIIQPPYAYDTQVYHKLPIKDRWIMNKLALAERIGHSCGPTGTLPSEGTFCIRPIMNMYGGGRGGFFKANGSDGRNNIPGYFWCGWFDGPHIWVQYINDKPVTYSKSFIINDVMTCKKVETNLATVEKLAPPLPECLRGISRYMMIESLGDKIIEASPRLMASSAFEWIVDDYKQFDPNYSPEDENSSFRLGQSDMERLPMTWKLPDGRILKGWKWSPEVDNNRRPIEDER